MLRRETWGFAVDADDGVWHMFSAGDEAGKRFRLTAIQDRNKNRIALTYEDNRLVEIVDSAGRLVRVLSTKEGRIASFQVKNAVDEGRWIAFATYGYDDTGRLVSAMDADGFTARYGYDEDNRLTDDADRTGLTFHSRYDNEQRCIESWGDYPGQRDPSLVDDLPKYLQDGVTRVKGIHHCKFEYFPEGYSEVADSTQVRRFFGTVHGTLTKSAEGGGVMTASYRDDGHLLMQVDAMGGKTSYDRDTRGRELKVVDPLGRTTMIGRDAAGLAIEVMDAAGGLSTAVRDRFGNVTAYTDVAGGVTSLRYDTRGLVTEQTSPSGAKTSYAYDEQGNRTATTLPTGAVWRSAFDALGRRQSVTDPLGATERYSYSARGDLVAVHDALGGATRYAYNGERRLTQMIDAKGRATELVWGGYRKLCERRDAGGNKVRFRYDLEGSLVEVHNEQGEVYRLEYDACGRFVGETTFEGRALRYKNDLLGRPIKIINGLGEKREITYDLAGQIVTRELSDGAVESFEYDALGAVVCAAWPTRFVWDGDVLVHEIKTTARAGGDPIIEERTYCFEDEGFAPTAHREKGEWTHYLSDPIGTPRRLIDEGGKVVGDVRRGVWGEGNEPRGRTTPLRFQGQYADDETGLSYNGYRYYDPETARFASADPSGLFGGLNTYAYARNSLSWIDPNGLVEIHRSGGVTVDAYPGPPAGGKEHSPLHAHVREGSTETRVLMEDYKKKNVVVACAGDVYPGDPAMTKGMKKMMKEPGILPTLQARTHSVFTTGSF